MTDENGLRMVEIEKEMQQSYLDYAMSVIISRALPDARDGLKPVQRRILYAMYDMGIRPDSSYKKSARIVGEVLGKYHPHGDASVYDAMARLAQDFTIRYPLVDGQGNFGSIDGDPPAAMRYTEAKLDSFSMELLDHIDQNTIDFAPNFDETLKEPLVLPSLVPNLLVNGASGIAVGMATNIPPHNLGEVVDAAIYILHDWDNFDDISVNDLMRFIKGPDFPTGGIVVLEDERNELLAAYATGRGRLTVRGRVHLEDMGRGRSRLIITEIPYQINKNGLIERIAQLVRDGTIEGISDLRDESDRQGMRIVIELSKTGDADVILRKLYKHTPLQTTFGIILLALVDNKPKVLNLKQALKVYLDHQIDVLIRRTKFDLEKAQNRAHILEGLLIAIKNMDAIIKIIRESENESEARETIMARFKLDQVQAQAILDMPLKRLTHLEHDKLTLEYNDLVVAIARMQALLDSPELLRGTVINDLSELKKRYTDPRRTRITVLGEGVSSKEVLTANALISADDVWVGMTKEGKIGRCDFERIGEKGFEIPEMIIRSDTQQTVYIVSESGKAIGLYVETLPRVDAFRDGIDLATVTGNDGEKPAAIFALPDASRREENASVITVTEHAMIKKSLASDLPFASSQSFVLCKVNAGDRLAAVLVSPNDDVDILLASRNGLAIRFDQKDLRPMGLAAAGVNGMKLKKEDILAGAVIVSEEDACCFVTSEWGVGQIMVKDFPRQGRYGQGVIALKLNADTFLAGLSLMFTGKSLLFVRYGKSKIREIRTALAKLGRRARTLNPIVKHGSEDVNSILMLDLELKESTTESTSKPPAPTAPAADVEQSNSIAETTTIDQTNHDQQVDENDFEQFSLF